MDEIKKLFSKQIVWYVQKKQEEKEGKIDSSYIYDELWDQFGDVRRGDWLRFMEILVSTPPNTGY